jgi:hypothetical protein
MSAPNTKRIIYRTPDDQQLQQYALKVSHELLEEVHPQSDFARELAKLVRTVVQIHARASDQLDKSDRQQ